MQTDRHTRCLYEANQTKRKNYGFRRVAVCVFVSLLVGLLACARIMGVSSYKLCVVEAVVVTAVGCIVLHCASTT